MTIQNSLQIGVVFDTPCFYETLTPRQIGRICKDLYKTWDDALYNSYLKSFKLPENKEIKGFSKGMQMKVSLAVALSHHPKLLILDEATSGLDPVARQDLLDLLLDFVQNEEHSILLSSHITSDLEKIADYIAFLHEGKLVFQKPKDELRYRYGILRCGPSMLSAIAKEDMLAVRREEYQCSILVSDKETMRQKYPSCVIDDATIDDILLLYIKGEVCA